MGRNFISVCHECQVALMHLRGHEGDHMQQFANDHAAHEKHTEVYDDYVDEPPQHYKDVFDEYNPDWENKLKATPTSSPDKAAPTPNKTGRSEKK